MRARAMPQRPGAGALAQRLAQILRVDHAGELGAVHIYRGQRAVFDASPAHARISGQLAEMEAHEAHHLARFEALLTETPVRPTLFSPLWRGATIRFLRGRWCAARLAATMPA